MDDKFVLCFKLSNLTASIVKWVNTGFDMIAPGQEDYETTCTFTVKAHLDRKHIVWIAI